MKCQPVATQSYLLYISLHNSMMMHSYRLSIAIAVRLIHSIWYARDSSTVGSEVYYKTVLPIAYCPNGHELVKLPTELCSCCHHNTGREEWVISVLQWRKGMCRSILHTFSPSFPDICLAPVPESVPQHMEVPL